MAVHCGNGDRYHLDRVFGDQACEIRLIYCRPLAPLHRGGLFLRAVDIGRNRMVAVCPIETHHKLNYVNDGLRSRERRNVVGAVSEVVGAPREPARNSNELGALRHI
jgi:hypothetical protein